MLVGREAELRELLGAASTARASGRGCVALVASDDGIGVYRRLGYLPVARWTMWFRG